MSELKKFDRLNSPERIQAILAAALAPITEAQIYALAGLNFDELDLDSQKEIKQVLSGDDVTKTAEEVPRYSLNDTAQAFLATIIDMNTVHGQIARHYAAKIKRPPSQQ